MLTYLSTLHGTLVIKVARTVSLKNRKIMEFEKIMETHANQGRPGKKGLSHEPACISM